MQQRLRMAAVLAGGFMAAVALAAPDIPMRDLDGKPRNVNEFIGQGKWTVVVAWAHDCHICGREIHEMSDFHAAHRDKDAQVLGVSIDGFGQAREARQFVTRYKLPFVNLIAEPSQEVMMKFGAGRFVGTPTYYVYNPQGEIVGQNVGPVTREEVETFLAAPDKPVDADSP
jgi:peroxiredoxin